MGSPLLPDSLFMRLFTLRGGSRSILFNSSYGKWREEWKSKWLPDLERGCSFMEASLKAFCYTFSGYVIYQIKKKKSATSLWILETRVIFENSQSDHETVLLKSPQWPPIYTRFTYFRNTASVPHIEISSLIPSESVLAVLFTNVLVPRSSRGISLLAIQRPLKTHQLRETSGNLTSSSFAPVTLYDIMQFHFSL